MTANPGSHETGKLPFREHLVELRSRLIKCLVTLGIIFLIAFNYSGKILDFLTLPLRPYLGAGNLVYLKPADGFFIFFKVALMIAVVFAMPVIVYQIFMFMAPGLYPGEKKALKVIIGLASVSFFSGFFALYHLILPVFFNFFSRFVFEFYEIFPDVTEYVDFVLKFNLYAGVLFMIPLGIALLAYFNIVAVERLIEMRKGAVLLAFILAAAMTPPDVVSQLLLSAVIMGLFEIGLLLGRMKLLYSRIFRKESA